LNIVGGGTKDRLLMQLTADALNIPVVAGPVEATAIGNVLGQAIAAGEIAGVTEARQVVRDSFEVVRYNPDPTVHAGYMRHFERFKKVL
jgi:rhamnulokinase